MKLALKITLLLLCNCIFSQSSELKEIVFNNEKKYIIRTINYPVSGVYKTDNAEPITELFSNGTGFYQIENEAKQPIIWGFESQDNGIPISIKGFDSVKYFLYYQFTNGVEGEENKWIRVEYLVQLKSQKLFINGNRMKEFVPKEKDKK